MKRLVVLVLILALGMMCVPLSGNSEGEDTMRLARVLYTLAANEDDDTMMKLGSVVMNRVDSPWYPDSVSGVLAEAQQFPCGSRYDERTLAAARALMSGKRVLPPEAVCYLALDAAEQPDASRVVAVSGNYVFCTRSFSF